ncbi:MAG: hypothetical protein JXN59_06615 [Anaerolineae bacterium]|nr:hypothetical protein [Anaerolineae bacterium]
MFFDLFIAAAAMAVGGMFFGQFEQPLPKKRRLSKLGIILGGTALLSKPFGHKSLLLISGMALAGGTYHTWWCRKHDIDPLTAEPYDRYLVLLREKYHLEKPAV